MDGATALGCFSPVPEGEGPGAPGYMRGIWVLGRVPEGVGVDKVH
jgi:hypothetical protein